jgi:SAM-dependent methyltransferase
MPDASDSSPFASTEAYYAEYRPEYGDEARRYLVDRFGLDESARVLDLGCGTGQIALDVAPAVGEVVGMDPNEAMLRAARCRADEAGIDNVEWVLGSDADLDTDLGSFRLTTMGRSFHWMDQRATLDRLHDLLEPGGGVALLTDSEWLTKGDAEWQGAVYDLADEYLDDLPDRVDPDEIEYDDPWDELLEKRGFTAVETATFDLRREWSLEAVVGYVFSLSYCSPETFGADKEAFESDVRALLRDRGGGPFVQHTVVEVISGRVPAGE